MCSRYNPLLVDALLNEYFGVQGVVPDAREELFPGDFGPFIRKHQYADVGDEAVPFKELRMGSFGLIPHWAKDTKSIRHTYNARTETVQTKVSFRDAWKRGRFCIIPAASIYEPDWRAGKCAMTKIVRTDGKPMGIAGIWTGWKNPVNGEVVRSYSMLTVNADDHPFMRNFHKPGDEKRMVVILQDDEYDAWLSATPEESRFFLRQYPAELMTVSE